MKTKAKYRTILLACVLISLSGILISLLCTHDPLDGTRGGTVAIGLTLAFVVLKSNLALKVYLEKQDARRKDPSFDDPAKDDFEKIRKRFEDIENHFRAASNDEEVVNGYLLGATIISTAAVAFGDVICRHLMLLIGIVPH